MKPFLFSACFLQKPCRYDGKAFEHVPEKLQKVILQFPLGEICPECDSGMSTPRPPSEIEPGYSGEDVIKRKAKLFNDEGENVTDYFLRGAEIACEKAEKNHCVAALLKNGSPSCGASRIYDGTFSGSCVSGCGVTAAALRSMGVKVFSEDDLEEFFEFMGSGA
jgi:uncharacterized protein YbbK (DUF523 family)